MLNISDFIQVLMLIASTAAIIVSAVMSRQAIKASMDMVREQNHIQMFAEYTKRYQDVIIALPQYDTVEEFINSKDAQKGMRLYFNLCSEEYDLCIKDAISKDVRDKWLSGMQTAMMMEAYRRSWTIQKQNYCDDFVSFFDNQVINHK